MLASRLCPWRRKGVHRHSLLALAPRHDANSARCVRRRCPHAVERIAVVKHAQNRLLVELTHNRRKWWHLRICGGLEKVQNILLGELRDDEGEYIDREGRQG